MAYKLIFIDPVLSPKKIEAALLPFLDEGYRVDHIHTVGKQTIFLLRK